ncbi:MAG TPA: hypothetical protein VFQ53_41710 [Kofleriaceae bacterium]|nr:hypothetical protein [Kofleriaceae bacterium]
MRCSLAAMSISLVLAACGGGGDSPPLPDADPNAPLCTGVVYDNCTSNAQCMSNNCHLFEQDAFQVCTQGCDANNPCPVDASGTVGTCNNRGICKPTRNNACRPE